MLSPSDGGQVPPSPTVSKGKKTKKKKGGGGVTKPNGDTQTATNGAPVDLDEANTVEKEDEAEDAITETLTDEPKAAAADSTIANPIWLSASPTIAAPESTPAKTTLQLQLQSRKKGTANGADTSARLEALAQERTALRDEVSSLRKALEEMQERHNGDLSKVQSELEDTRMEKAQAESNYNSLRDRVGTIRSTLNERLNQDAARIEELEDENATLKSQSNVREEEIASLASQIEEKNKDISNLRNRSNLSNQNWSREKEEMLEREATIKSEFESAKQAMQDWEILAMEERSIRETLGERVAELEEQVTTHREAHERLKGERSTLGQTVDGLQRALQELQEARKAELREVVENSQSQLVTLRKELEEAKSTASAATMAKESTAKELERLQPLESEIKEKNLIIGKLRHQAVGLNEHLTNALRQLKRGKSEDNVDRELVTNHFLHFLSLDRSDPRKFQILQIIASVLNWSDEQREQAGLARPGTSNPSLRTPISPWNRTPSTPSLTDLGLTDRGRQDSVSVGGAFAEFLERESEDGAQHLRSTSHS